MRGSIVFSVMVKISSLGGHLNKDYLHIFRNDSNHFTAKYVMPSRSSVVKKGRTGLGRDVYILVYLYTS